MGETFLVAPQLSICNYSGHEAPAAPAIAPAPATVPATSPRFLYATHPWPPILLAGRDSFLLWGCTITITMLQEAQSGSDAVVQQWQAGVGADCQFWHFGLAGCGHSSTRICA